MKKMKSLLLSALLLTFVGLFSACSSEEENYLSSLPAESSMVFKLDVAQMVTKSNVLNNPLVSGMLMQADQHVPETLKAKNEEIKQDPAAAGIDLQKPLAVAISVGDLNLASNADFSNASVVCVAAISDVKKFDELMKEMMEIEPSITMAETEGAKEIKLPEDGFSIAYNDSRIVVAYGQNQDAVSLVNQKASESMLAHPNFAEFAANDKDASLFMDYGWVMEIMAEAQKNMNAPTSVSPQLMEYMKGMSVYGALNFETGKIAGDMKVYPSEAAKKYMEEFYMEPTDKFVGLLPKDSYLGFNFAIKNYSECLKYMGEEVRQQVDEMLKQYGLSEEIIDNVHGDILIGAYQDPDNAMIPGMIVAIQCKDRTLFDKVKEMMMITAEGDMFEIPNMGYCVTYIDDAMIISTKGLYNQCLASGKIKAWGKSWKDSSMGQVLKKGGIAIDFQAICQSKLWSLVGGSKEAVMALSILKQLEAFTMQMESMQETHSELVLINKDKNALEQLIAIAVGAAMAR